MMFNSSTHHTKPEGAMLYVLYNTGSGGNGGAGSARNALFKMHPAALRKPRDYTRAYRNALARGVGIVPAIRQ